jgi:tight adherence protein C
MTGAVLAALAGVCGVGAIVPTHPAPLPLVIATRRRSRWAERLAVRTSERVRRRMADRLEAARSTWTVEEVVAVRRLAAVSLVAAALLEPGLMPLALALALPVARGPDIILARLAKRSLAAARRELPLFLDLLSVATAAGIAPQLAVRRCVEPLEGPLGVELRRAIAATDLGQRWRDELRAAARRLALADLSRAVELLVRTERLGSSLADEMGRLATDVRDGRRARATERARAAPVKMLFPLVFLILPAFLLLTVVPVLLTTVGSIG